MFNYCYDSSRYCSCYRWTSCICRFDGTSYSKILIGTDYAKILPLTALLGGILVLVADVIARYLGEAPVGAIISFIGVPYFLYLVKKGGRSI